MAAQLLLGYSKWDDEKFEEGTEAVADPFRFAYRGTKYVIWAWKGEYLGWGDGGEVALYAKNNGLLDGVEGWNAVPFDSNLPKMKVSLSVGDSQLGSFAPRRAQDWVGIYDPSVRDTNLNDIHATVTVAFPNAAMYAAFIDSPDVQSHTKLFSQFDRQDNTVTFTVAPLH